MKWRLYGIGLSFALFGTSASAQQITVLSYGGLFQERYTKSVIEPFEQANPGIKVSYFGLPSSGQMLGMLRAQKASPQADVAILDVTVSKAGTDEGIFAPLDEKSIPNVADLFPNAHFPGVNGVGVTFDNFDIVYNPSAVPKPPAALSDLASPDMKGKVAFSGMPDIVGLSAIVVMDKADGGPGIAGKFDKGFAAMGKIAPNILTWDPQPEVYPVVIGGEAGAGIGWNARAQYNAKMSGGKLVAVVPSEGTVFQINTINLVANSPAPDIARKFINYALSPEAQKRFTEDMFYAPTNSKSQIDKAAADRTALTHMDKVIPVDWLAIATIRDALMNQWRRQVLPLSR